MTSSSVFPANDPIPYFPVSQSPFEFKMGLRKLASTNSFQSMQDTIFQFDNTWNRYRNTKLRSRREDFNKYICRIKFNNHTETQVVAFIINQLKKNYPNYFNFTQSGDAAHLDCWLTNERLVFNDQLELVKVMSINACNNIISNNSSSNNNSSDNNFSRNSYCNTDSGDNLEPNYVDALDALCCQVQEDLTINILQDSTDYLAYLHLCLPNDWAAEDKIGQSIEQAHEVVPGMEKISPKFYKMLNMLVSKGPFERFTWGLVTDNYLNHHPIKPNTKPQKGWYGRDFSADLQDQESPFYLRIERQITIPFAESNSYVFTIRTYFREVGLLSKSELSRLLLSVNTMPELILEYKGLASQKGLIIDRLKRLIEGHHHV